LGWSPSNYARSHEAGRSADVTIAGLDMGTDFDHFIPRSLADATDGITSQRQANRELLRTAM
jgi:zinc D-Ala-D-Ala dipeptidase